MPTLTHLTALTQLTRQLDQSWRDTGQDPLAGPPIALITKDGVYLITKDGKYLGVPANG